MEQILFDCSYQMWYHFNKGKGPVVATYNLLDQSMVGRGGFPQCPPLSVPLTTTPSLSQR